VFYRDHLVNTSYLKEMVVFMDTQGLAIDLNNHQPAFIVSLPSAFRTMKAWLMFYKA